MTTQYVMQETDDEWVQPTPVQVAIRETVTSDTELETDDLDDLESYVDLDDLRAVLETNDATAIELSIEGYDVRVHQCGEIAVVESGS